MLSITPVASASNATNYYLNDEKSLNMNDVELKKDAENYYLKEKSNEPNTQWFGKLADEQGLSGKEIDDNTLKSALSGELQGEIVHGRREKHKGGFDLTFSAPKSASILALVGGDKRLLDEHVKAVKYTLKQLEKDTAQVKTTNPDTHKTEFENTENLLFGLVTHKTSRENEPAMHTHVLMPNMTRDNDGKLRALASSLKQSGNEVNGTSERIYRDQKYYGILYQSTYAKAVQELGYSTKSVGNGMFEIKEVPETLRQSFSTRAQQINDKIEDLGVDSLKTRDLAAKNTRQEKTHTDETELTASWQDKTREQGVDLTNIITATYDKSPESKQPTSEQTKAATQSIDRTIAHLSQSSAFLTYEKIITLAVSEFSKGEVVDIENVKAQIDNQIKSGALIPLDEKATKFTTQNMVDKEKEIINTTKGHNRSVPITVNPKALNNLNLDVSNKQKITDLLTSNKQFNVVNLFGHSKQITANLQHVATNSGSRVHFITNDAKSLKETKQDTKHQSFTPMQWVNNLFREESVSNVNAFLTNKDSLHTSKDLWVVENANKLSVAHLQSITEKAKATKSKVVYLNHTSSRQGMNANSAMNLYQKGNVNSVNWVNNKESESQVRLHQTPNQESKSIAQSIAAMTNTDNVQVLANTKKDIATLNTDIRQALKNTGKVSRMGVSIQTETPHFISKPQREIVTNYKKGMNVKEWVTGDDGKKTLNSFVIASTNRKDNTLTLAPVDSKGDAVPPNTLTAGGFAAPTAQHETLDPSTRQNKKREFTFYTTQKVELAQGDKIKSGAKHFASKLPANTQYTIASANSKKITLHDDAGKTHTINTAKLHNAPISYHYAESINKIDRDKTHLIVQTKSYAASKELLQDLTATSSRVDIYTDKAQALDSKLNKSEVRPSSIEKVVQSQGNNNKWLSQSTEDVLKQDLRAALDSIKEQHKPISDVDSAVKFAINHMSEKQAGFKHQDLVSAALKYALSKENAAISPATVMAALEKHPNLISAEYQDGTRWTTKAILETENQILTAFESGKNVKEAVATPQEAKLFLDNHPDKTQGQKEAITLMATTTDRFIAIQGLAGVGKSTMLETAVQLFQQQAENKGQDKLNVIGLAPTHAAVKELTDKGVQAQTLQSLLSDEKGGKLEHSEYKNALIILDESSMADNTQFKELTEFAEKVDASVVFLGDIKQLQSLGAGVPFQLGIERTIVSTEMNQILRQKNETLLGAVQNAVDRQGHSLLDKIEKQATFTGYQPSMISEQSNQTPTNEQSTQPANKSFNVVEVKAVEKTEAGRAEDDKPQSIEEAVAKEYLARTPEARENTLIVAYTNKERDNIASAVREGLQKEGSMNNEDISISRLRAVNTSREEMATTLPYKEGMVLSGMGDDYLHVKEVNNKAGFVTLINEDTSKEKILVPSNHDHTFTTLWHEEKKELAVGEAIVTRKTDKDVGIIANTQYKVTSLENNQLTAQTKDGKILTLSTKDIKDAHWDYAYAKTANMAQGSTYHYVIGAIKGKAPLTDIRRAYIDTSRAQFHVKLFVDDKASVLNAWETKNADNISATDLVEKTKNETPLIFNNSPTPNDKYKNADGAFSLNVMKDNLNERSKKYTESLAEYFLGQPDKEKSTNDTLIFNQGKNRISVSLKGQYRGYFKNWNNNEKGSFINLIMDKENISYKEALFKLENILNEPKENNLIENKNNDELVNQTQQNVSKLETRAIEYAKQSQPTKNTIAEKYLASIGIKNENPNLKFHPAVYSSEDGNTHPALIANVTDKNDNIKAIKITYLDDQGEKADLNINPRNLGSVSGNKTNITLDDNNKTTVITTDINDALSVAALNLKTDIINIDNVTDKTTSLKGLKDQVLLIVNESENGDTKIDIDKILSRIEKSNPDAEIKAITEAEIKNVVNEISAVKIPEELNEKQNEKIQLNDINLDSGSSRKISDKNMSALEIYNDSKTHELPTQEKENESQAIRGVQLEKEM
jgi:conjugative transfer relaxase protein TraI